MARTSVKYNPRSHFVLNLFFAFIPVSINNHMNRPDDDANKRNPRTGKKNTKIILLQTKTRMKQKKGKITTLTLLLSGKSSMLVENNFRISP